MTLLLIASFGVMLASFVGVLATWKTFGNFLERHLDFLISFSAGVFLIVALSLSSETIEHAGAPSIGLFWILVGALTTWVLFRYLPILHHHEHAHAHVRPHPINPERVLLSDAVHNVGDGILLAAAFAAGPIVGFSTAVAVFVHEVVQETSEFFVLRGAGYSFRRAILASAAVSSTLLLGAFAGYFALESVEVLEVPLLGIAAGMILVVLLGDLVPHSFSRYVSFSHYAKHILWFALGALVMFGVSQLVPHEEPPHIEDYSVGEVVL